MSRARDSRTLTPPHDSSRPLSSVIHRHDGVECSVEHRPQPRLARANSLFGLTPGDELPHLAAQLAHRLEQPLVWLTQLTRVELHHSDYATRAQEREAEGRMQPVMSSDFGPWEVRILRGVDDPDGLA